MYYLNHATRGRALRGRLDRAGWLPRCIRTDGRVREWGKPLPKLSEPCTFVHCVLKERSTQTWRPAMGDGRLAFLTNWTECLSSKRNQAQSSVISLWHASETPGWSCVQFLALLQSAIKLRNHVAARRLTASPRGGSFWAMHWQCPIRLVSPRPRQLTGNQCKMSKNIHEPSSTFPRGAPGA